MSVALLAMNAAPSPVDPRHKWLALIAAAIQLAMALLVSASPLLVIGWGVAVLVVAWISSSVWALRIWRRHQLAAFGPVAAMVVFYVSFLNIGDMFLDGFGA
jgi:hypothetical protein